MKKLMIAACAVAFAAVAQAAQYEWGGQDTSSGYLEGYEEQAAGGTAYLFFNGGDYDIADLRAAVISGDFFNDGWDAKALDSTGINNHGVFSNKSEEGLAGKTGDSFYAVLVANESFDYETGDSLGKVDPVMAYITDSFTPVTVEDKGGTGLSFDPYGDGTGTSSAVGGNWYAQSVPEPTSGLLLLLGVAGMALRRRRA